MGIGMVTGIKATGTGDVMGTAERRAAVREVVTYREL
jgi:hypothetical protein